VSAGCLVISSVDVTPDQLKLFLDNAKLLRYSANKRGAGVVEMPGC
jgi:hypothetical protein